MPDILRLGVSAPADAERSLLLPSPFYLSPSTAKGRLDVAVESRTGIILAGVPRGCDLQPGQGAVPAGGPHQARSRPLLPRRRRRRAARRRRPSRTCWCAIPTASTESSSIRSARRNRGRLDRGRRAAVPVGPHRGRSRAARCGGARVDGEPRLPRAASASGARRGPRSSRRAARRSRSGAGRRVAAGPRSRAVVRATLARLRTGRLAEDLGSRGMHVYVRIEPRWTFDRGAPRRAGARARSRAPRAGDRHQQVVEGRAPRRLPRLQPERQGPHGRRGLFGAADAGCARVGAADLGRDRRRAIPATSR